MPNLDDFVDANFQLLTDSLDGTEFQLSEEVPQNVQEEINELIAGKEAQEMDQNNDSSEEFEDAAKTVRHVTVNEDCINYFSVKKDKDSTKEQTEWAVNVLRGKYKIFHSNYLHKSNF